MADLTTKYLGLNLKNPIIAASSGLTASLQDIKQLESNGAAAVVLKSLFEEEILLEAKEKIKEAEKDNFMYTELSETFDYIDLHVKEDKFDDYLKLVSDVKEKVLIPVIASVNCVTPYEWTEFTMNIEKAGADALELNIFLNPTDLSDKDFEQTHIDIIKKVIQQVSIPVSVKISPYYTKLGVLIKKISEAGVAGIVLFNRFYTPDIDLETMKIISANIYSTPVEQGNVLRWTGLMANKIECDLAASTGIHTSQDIIKQILVGANAVQLASVLYQKGIEHIPVLLKEIEVWMDKKGFQYINQFKGKVSQESSGDPASFERMQFMKFFSGIK